MADAFFPPISLKSHDLITMFEKDAWKDHEDFSTEAYLAWREDVLTLLPKLSIDALVELAYFLSFEAKLNDKEIWRAFEGAVLESIHLIDLKHACQLQWGTSQLKPKGTSARLSDLLFGQARERAEQGL